MPTDTLAIPSWVAIDLEWASTVHSMQAPALLGKDMLASYVDFDRRSIDWERIAEESPRWSHGEKLLIGVAWDMWRGRGETALWDLVGTLDAANLAHVITTVQIRRGLARFDGTTAGALEDLAHRVELVGNELIALEDEIDVHSVGHDWGTNFGDLSAFSINRLAPLAHRIRASVL